MMVQGAACKIRYGAVSLNAVCASNPFKDSSKSFYSQLSFLGRPVGQAGAQKIFKPPQPLQDATLGLSVLSGLALELSQ